MNTNGSVETAPEHTAIVVSREAALESYKKGLEPANIMAAMQLATAVAATKICGVQSPEDALVRLLTGRELGLTAMQSIQAVYVVDGKPGLYAEVMEALAIQHPECEKWEWLERTDKGAKLLVKRRGRPEQVISWTEDDARRAGLFDRGKDPKDNNYHKHPRRMYTARCRSEAASLMFPDAMRGIKSIEEISDRDAPPPPAPGEGDSQAIATAQAAHAATAKALKDKIAAVKSTGEQKAVRAEIEEAIKKNMLAGPYLDDVKAAYNERFSKKTQASTADTQAPSPPDSEPKRTREPGED